MGNRVAELERDAVVGVRVVLLRLPLGDGDGGLVELERQRSSAKALDDLVLERRQHVPLETRPLDALGHVVVGEENFELAIGTYVVDAAAKALGAISHTNGDDGHVRVPPYRERLGALISAVRRQQVFHVTSTHGFS